MLHFSSPNSINLHKRRVFSLPDFAQVKNFLDHDIAEAIYKEASITKFSDFCVFFEGDTILTKFGKPDREKIFISIHKRTKNKIKSIDLLCKYMQMNETVLLLSNITGLPLTKMRPLNSGIFIKMVSGNFLEDHTDFGPSNNHTKLVISLSLTKNWQKSFGGATIYHWGRFKKRIFPRFNEAVLFIPHEKSLHKVVRVTEKANVSRYTMTFHYV